MMEGHGREKGFLKLKMVETNMWVNIYTFHECLHTLVQALTQIFPHTYPSFVSHNNNMPEITLSLHQYYNVTAGIVILTIPPLQKQVPTSGVCGTFCSSWSQT